MVQGDIVPNATVNVSSEASPGPVTPPAATTIQPAVGYAQPVAAPAQPTAYAQPEPPRSYNIQEAIAAPRVAAPVETGSHRSRTPLVLTVVGVVIFIGGVSGLFMYALSGM